MDNFSTTLVLTLSYLIGSLSPSYFLGKVLKGVDIRKHGNGNAGTVNVFHVIGPWPAVFTALFDFSKGFLPLLAVSFLGASPTLIFMVGIMAIIGHVFPFYLQFRGGQGVATASAILIYYLLILYSNGWMPWESLIFLSVCTLSFALITKKGELVGIVILPLLSVMIFTLSSSQEFNIYIITIILYILFINVMNIFKSDILHLSKEIKEEVNWRLYLRPLALLLVIYYLNTSKSAALTLIGIITLLFFSLDIFRLLYRKINSFFFKNVKTFYKHKEYKKFSSITLFLFAFFLTVLVFEKEIAIFAVVFLILGDFFSKFFGIFFGRHKIFEKSYEGSLAHFNACLIGGYIFFHFLSLPFHIFLLGALVATFTEMLPLGLDDNFSVPLVSATTMYLLLSVIKI
jgi:acyl phosphate:glycerol-3-phosphate acyltransferase